MILMTQSIRAALRANGATRPADPVPLLKLFNPVGPATWLATELDADGDTLFGLADLGFGCPELGSFSLGEIAALRLGGGEVCRPFFQGSPARAAVLRTAARGSAGEEEGTGDARDTAPPRTRGLVRYGCFEECRGEK